MYWKRTNYFHHSFSLSLACKTGPFFQSFHSRLLYSVLSVLLCVYLQFLPPSPLSQHIFVLSLFLSPKIRMPLLYIFIFYSLFQCLRNFNMIMKGFGCHVSVKKVKFVSDLFFLLLSFLLYVFLLCYSLVYVAFNLFFLLAILRGNKLFLCSLCIILC